MAWLISRLTGGAVLTREERRALRAIEEALEAEDPRLAALLREPPEARRKRLVRRLRWSAGTIVAILLLLAVLLSSAELMFMGMATLMAFPVIRWWDPDTRSSPDG
jgi:dihydroorotase-like cyclic amidohydrolase